MEEEEIKTILAFLFKRAGETSLAASELYLSLSVDLNWFTLEKAREVIRLALNQNLLIKEEGFLKPNFEYKKIIIPTGFRPSGLTMVKKEKEMQKSLLEKLVQHISMSTDKKERSILEKITTLAEEKDIFLEIAALLLGKECDVDISLFFEDVEKQILRGNE
ncbi:hypothetical protein MBGDN05_00251 [Thermoplasmatales archaeon SCGC AB-539-N05]|nr:hypothetical protein MBGDN05_00251 [Thermoplasmatales archaeon SCGC AB-539-N05]